MGYVRVEWMHPRRALTTGEVVGLISQKSPNINSKKHPDLSFFPRSHQGRKQIKVLFSWLAIGDGQAVGF
jgi:hypothetical protein